MAHMDVLLCEDVENLGQRGEVVRVRSGFGRNYLLPQGLAIEATTGNKRMIHEQRRVLAKREDRERPAQGEAGKLEGLELIFDRRVGDHGLLYGSVTHSTSPKRSRSSVHRRAAKDPPPRSHQRGR